MCNVKDVFLLLTALKKYIRYQNNKCFIQRRVSECFLQPAYLLVWLQTVTEADKSPQGQERCCPMPGVCVLLITGFLLKACPYFRLLESSETPSCNIFLRFLTLNLTEMYPL